MVVSVFFMILAQRKGWCRRSTDKKPEKSSPGDEESAPSGGKAAAGEKTPIDDVKDHPLQVNYQEHTKPQYHPHNCSQYVDDQLDSKLDPNMPHPNVNPQLHPVSYINIQVAPYDDKPPPAYETIQQQHLDLPEKGISTSSEL